MRTPRELCLQAYKRTGSRGYFLLYAHTLINPQFLSDECTRGIPNNQGYQDKKGLLEVLVNRLMGHPAKSSGKKMRLWKSVVRVVAALREKKRYQDAPLSWVLAVALVNSSPDRMVLNSRYGSGVLTKAVWMTFPKRINWFLSQLTRLAKSKKSRSFEQVLSRQLELCLDGTARGSLLNSKRELDMASARANLS